MTREEYVKIYQAQQAKLKEKQPTQVVISAIENELLEKAAIFADGQIVDLDTHSIDDIYGLIEIVFGLLEKVKDNKKINDLLILLDALQLIVDEDELEKEEKQKKKEKEKSQEHKQVTENAKPQDKIDENLVKQKAKDYGAWAKQQLQSSGKPHKPASRLDLIDTKAFDGLSRKELLEYYTPSKFYSLSGKQRDALCQATVNEYLISNGCRPCPVGFMDMPINDRCVYYGLYRPQYQEIFINDNLFNNIDTLSDQNNTNFPYQILSTLIHEATHHMQFSDIERGDDNEKTRLIKRSMMNNQNNMSFSEYLAEADELDARNSALEYIREASYEAGAGMQNLMAFYNVQKNSEIKSPKKEVSKQVHSFFPDIYDNTFLSPSIESTSRMTASAKEMNEIIKGHFIAENLQRRKRF